jgi:hypothetical protein
MKHKLIYFFLVFSTVAFTQQTIVSTSGGGTWTNPSTWIGSVVPSASDHVVIDGPVIVGGTITCNNLTISSGKTLINNDGGTTNLYVNGNISNLGSINNNANGWSFNLYIAGDVTNNGVWRTSITYLTSTVSQSVTASTDAYFDPSTRLEVQNSSTTIQLTSPFYLKNQFVLNGAIIQTNENPLYLNAAGKFLNGTVQSVRDVRFLNAATLGSSIANLTFEGDSIKLHHLARLGEMTLNGSVIVMDTLINISGQTTNLTINGDLINQGEILNNESGWSFRLHISKDLHNYGVWKTNETNLSGTGVQRIYCGMNNYFEPNSWLKITGTPTTVQALTPLYLKSRFLMENKFVDLMENPLFLNNNGRFENGTVNTTKHIYFQNTAYLGAQGSNLTVIGDSIYLHHVSRMGEMTIQGTVSVEDTLINITGQTTNLTINGDLINHGKILNNESGWSFYLHISKDLHNYGIWKTNETNLSGTGVQRIYCGMNNYFEPNSWLKITGTPTSVQANTTLYLKSRFLLNAQAIHLNENHLYISDNGRFENGTVNTTKHIYFQNTAYLGAQGSNLTVIGDSIYLHHVSRMGEMTIQGTVSVEDTLINITGQTTNLTIIGDLINHGKILNNESGWSFLLHISKDLHNYGIWKTNETNLNGTATQSIYCGTNNYFEPLSWLKVTGTATLVQANTPLYLKSRFLLNAQAIQLNENHLYISDNGRFENGTVNTTKHIYFQNTAYLGAQGSNLTVIGDSIYLHHVSRMGEMTIQGTVSVEDTLINISGQTTNLTINGDLINQGKILNNESGWSFYLNISKDLHNYGIWETNQTNLSGTNEQKIFCGTDNYFEPTSWLKVTGTPSMIEVNTGFYLKSRFLLNADSISVLSNNLYLSGNGRFENGKVKDAKNIYFDANAYLGSSGHNLILEGDSIFFFQNARLGEITINAVVSVLENLSNISSQTSNISINGNVTNFGLIERNANGWTMNLTIDGSFQNLGGFTPQNVHISGNIENVGTWENTNLTLFGNNERNVKANGVVSNNYYFIDSIKFIGNNVIPKLVQHSSDPVALVTVMPDAAIEFTDRQAPSQLLNRGKVFWTQSITSTTSTTYSFYKSNAKNRVGTSMSQLTVEGFEGSLPPGISNSMTHYWRLLNDPRDYNDTLVELNLFYNENELNSNVEDELKVFFSNDGGLNWSWMNSNVTHTPADNKFRILNAPSTGIYILASSELGISAIRPKITMIETNTGGNLGQVSPQIFGQSLTANAIVRLQNGATTVIADTVYLSSEFADVLSVAFTFDNEAPGLYDVVVEIPGDTIMTLNQAFTLEAATGAKPNVFLSGRQTVLINRWQTYTITYSNIGNVDAKAVPLFIAVSDRPGLEIEFLDFEIENPEYAYENGYGEYVDTAAIYFLADSAFSDYSGVRVYPFYIPSIPANSVSTVKFRIKTPSSVKVQVAMQDPLFINPMKTEMAECMIGILGEGIIDITTGAIPVVGCITAVGKNVFKTANSISTNGKKSWRSWMKDWAITFVDCGINLSGVGAVVKAVGIFTVNMKGYADAFAECKAKYNKEIDVNAVNSYDPNEKVGPAGFAEENYIAYPDDISYTIFFENLETSTAPAQTVHIVDTLDANAFNFETFNFGTVGFGMVTLNPIRVDNGFTLYKDLRPSKDIILEVKGNFDPSTGVLTWDFTSLDPMELELTEDPFGGFLPPNVSSPEGEGFVQFSIQLKDDLDHDAQFKNKASIVFDVNAPILTNNFSNKLDLIAPTGEIDAFEMMDDTTVVLSWYNTSDIGSGIREYIVYISKNGAEYLPYFTNSGAQSMIFIGELDSNYRFYLVGIDSVGNTQLAPTSPNIEITFTSSGIDLVKQHNISIYPNPVESTLSIAVSGNQSALRYEIRDLQGKLIQEDTFSNGNLFSISVDSLNAGMYMIHIIQDNSSKSIKFIKK